MKRLCFALVVLFALSSAAYGRDTAARRGRVDKRSPQSAAQVEKEPPCQAYVVMEASTGKILEGNNIDIRWPPASVAKLMLAPSWPKNSSEGMSS